MLTLDLVYPYNVSDEVADRLSTMLYDLLGFKINITFVPQGFLERSSGKSKRVVDNR